MELADKDDHMTSWLKSLSFLPDLIKVMILLAIVFIVILGFSKKEDPYLHSMKPIIFKIMNHAGYRSLQNDKDSIPIYFRKSNDRTYTIDKQKIYVVSEKPNGQKYNRDTLLYVMLHEIAHILSPEEHHTKGFYQIEKRLHSSAIELGYLNMHKLEKSYPCWK